MIQSCIQAWDGKLEKSDIVRGTGIELQSVHNIIESLKNDEIVQEQENSKLSCLKRKFSDDAVRAMRKRANNISQ
jgi:predicted transcriptional regulator